LVWAGEVTNDTLSPLRALLAGGTTRHAVRRGASARYRRPGRPSLPSRTGPPTVGGRWSLLGARDLDPTRRADALASALLDRYGVVVRGAVAAEGVPGGFAAVYPVLAAYEEAGRARRGYFVEGLGGAQFADTGAVERLRAVAAELSGDNRPQRAVVLAATDPANPYGAALGWPSRLPDEDVNEGRRGHQPGRKAGALVVLVDGALTLYVERGGRTLLSFTAEPQPLALAAQALAGAVHAGWLGSLAVERADGVRIGGTTLADALETAGFRPTPRGLRLRG
ncbi:MAG TPA: hypothetical protein VGR21_04105, partial [Cryptosporangiaceae bacterium]|nr:hypothetical protein [Cryptosporangiaceae bacterium]